MNMTQPGGYVLSQRNIALHSDHGHGTSAMDVPNTAFRGSLFDFGKTDLSVRQETNSFRTNRFGTYPDLTSGSEILRYFLMHGIQDKLDTGHDFWTTQSWTQYSHLNAFVRSGSGSTWARGTLSAGAPPVPIPSSLNVNYYGNKAISKISPTTPHTNLAQTAAEAIREHVAELPGSSLIHWLESRSLFYHSLGKEYLNVAFGWKPFLNDVIKIIKSIRDINDEIRQYLGLSGTLVRRRYDFFPIVEASHSENDFGFINLGTGSNIGSWTELYNGSPQGKLLIDDTREEQIYFKGAFSYFVPMDNSIFSKLQVYEGIVNNLLGTRITPSVLWELTSWSWLFDWFVDVQSALQVADYSFSGEKFQLRYAYLMREIRMSSTYTVVGPSFVEGPLGPFTSTTHFHKKERVRGTPFGFGINPSDISPGQWAILAALAISKGPRKLPHFPRGEVTD